MLPLARARLAGVHACAALVLTLVIAAPAATAANARARPSNAEILFRMSNPCPASGATSGPCSGYVVDRIIPVGCGGAEEPSNMRWITTTQAREKARWEKIGCRRGRKLVLPGGESTPTEAFGLGDTPAPVRALPLGSKPEELPAPPAAPAGNTGSTDAPS